MQVNVRTTTYLVLFHIYSILYAIDYPGCYRFPHTNPNPNPSEITQKTYSVSAALLIMPFMTLSSIAFFWKCSILNDS